MKRLAAVGVRYAAITGLFFVAILSFDQGWRRGVPAGIGAGAAFGMAVAVFELIWGLVASRARSRGRNGRPPFPGETVVKTGDARHVVGIDTVPGCLYLTNRALHFRSDRGAAPVQKWSVALLHIRRADVMRTLGLIPSGLRIVTNRETERFVTDDDGDWSRTIASAIQAVAQRGDGADKG